MADTASLSNNPTNLQPVNTDPNLRVSVGHRSVVFTHPQTLKQVAIAVTGAVAKELLDLLAHKLDL